MDVEIINKSFSVNLYGYSGFALNNDYAATAFKLMNKMWETLNSKKIKNNGINIWVYELNEKVFAGVEVQKPIGFETGLETKEILLSKYAYHKHLGPYNLLKEAGQKMREELHNKGFETMLPYVEVYGHWTNDENQLVTEMLMALK